MGRQADWVSSCINPGSVSPYLEERDVLVLPLGQLVLQPEDQLLDLLHAALRDQRFTLPDLRHQLISIRPSRNIHSDHIHHQR